MAEYSREDAQIAERVMQQLDSRETEGIELPDGFVVSDVEADTTRFQHELDVVRSFGSDMPCVVINKKPVPISLDLLLDRRIHWRYYRGFPEEAYYWLFRDVRESLDPSLVFTPPEEARGMFLRRATEFLATRLAGLRSLRESGRSVGPLAFLSMRQHRRGVVVSTPGCQFTVSTNSSGLRVFWSGAYYVTPNNFGYPTTPTSSVLQSGTYIFGVDGGAYGSTVQWDLTCVCSLPGNPYAHLNY